MAAINYQDLLDTLLAAEGEVPEAEKRNALSNVVNVLSVQEPDEKLSTRAVITRLTLSALNDEINAEHWLEDEFVYYENELEKKLADQQNADVEMEGGRKKRRRGKKTKKVKKNRRFTRRR